MEIFNVTFFVKDDVTVLSGAYAILVIFVAEVSFEKDLDLLHEWVIQFIYYLAYSRLALIDSFIL